jgi:hypothetical protein
MFETVYLEENVKKQIVAQNIKVSLGYFVFSKKSQGASKSSPN